MHILLASLLLTSVSPAYSSSAPLPQTYSDRADDGYAYRIDSGVGDFSPQYGRGYGATIRVAASTGFTIEEFEASSDDLLPSTDDSTNTGKSKPRTTPGLTIDNLKNMGPCCPSGPGWLPGATFCQHSVWKDLNRNGKFEPKEQIILLHETGQRDLKTGKCKKGPILGSGGKGRHTKREPPKTKIRDQSKIKPPPSHNDSRSGPPGTTFDCDLGLKSMGVRVVKSRFAKIQHMKDGRGSFGCYYQISGVKSKTLISAGWVEAPYKRGRYTFGKTNCGQGLWRTNFPPGPMVVNQAYFRGVNGKAAYVSALDTRYTNTPNRGQLDIIGVNRFKAIAKKMLAQIEPRAVDCPK